MYEEYFGLKRSPFRITPDTSLFYDGGQRGDILGALVYAIHRGEGIVKVVGEVGSGKTMLCRMLQLELPDTVEIVYIANPSISAEDILFVIAAELKFDLNRESTKHEVVTMLQNYLLKRHAENRQVVLFVEEAQGMPLETLEEIRLLSNLETDQHKLLQIVLFGQPELDQNLATNSIRQLRERITHDFQLSPLSPPQIHTYLNFRMREVGYTGPELINKKLARKMAVYSEGLLRRINILADKMLLSAFADGTHTLTHKHLADAVKDSGFSALQGSGSSNRWFWLVGSFALLLLVTLAYGMLQYYYPFAQKVNFSQKAEPEEIVITTNLKPVIPVSRPASEAFSGKAVTMPAKKTTNEKIIVVPELKSQVNSLQKAKIRRILETAVNTEKNSVEPEMMRSSKKIQQSDDKLDKVAENQSVEVLSSSKKSDKYSDWLQNKIETSKEWLRGADKEGVSIQVMMRNQSAARDLSIYLQTEWPLDLDKTYLYEVKMKNKQIFRVFYDEYPTISLGQMKIKQLPESVRLNSPYLHSIYRMQKALL